MCIVKKFFLTFIVIIGGGIVVTILLFPINSKKISYSSHLNSSTDDNKSEHKKVYISFVSEQLKKREKDDKKIEIDKTIKYITEDIKGRYKILLKDESLKDINVSIIDGYKRVIGTINGIRFVLKVPLKSIESSDLKLIVIDKQTGKKKEIDAQFLSELSTLQPNQRYHFNLNFDDISDITSHIVETTKIFPGP